MFVVDKLLERIIIQNPLLTFIAESFHFRVSKKADLLES